MAINKIRKALIALAGGSVEVTEEAAKLADKRTGVYTNAVLAAIYAGNVETLEAEMLALIDDIKANKRGIAERLGCPMSKKQPADGVAYNVPSALSAAKSYMLDALRMGIDVGNEKDPRPFGAIRDEVRTAKAAAARAALTGDDALRAELVEACDAIKERATALDGDTLASAHTIATTLLQSLRDAAKAANGVADNDASDGESLAAAA